MDDRRVARDRRLRLAEAGARAGRPGSRRRPRSPPRGCAGAGGANFATGQKWSFLPKDTFPRYLVVNGDEGEPSTFKDRMLLERDPHQLLEGIVIAAYAIQCNLAFVYCRGEFALGYDRLPQAIARREGEGLPRQRHPRFGFRPRHRRAPRRGRVHLRRRDRAARVARGRAWHAAAEAAVPRDRGALREADRRQQRRDACRRCRTSSRMGGEEYAKLGVARSTGHADLFAVGPREAARQLRDRVRLHVPRHHLRSRRRHPRRQRRSSSSCPAARRSSGCRPTSTSTSPTTWTTRAAEARHEPRVRAR